MVTIYLQSSLLKYLEFIDAEALLATVMLHSSLSEADFKGLSNQESMPGKEYNKWTSSAESSMDPIAY